MSTTVQSPSCGTQVRVASAPVASATQNDCSVGAVAGAPPSVAARTAAAVAELADGVARDIREVGLGLGRRGHADEERRARVGPRDEPDVAEDRVGQPGGRALRVDLRIFGRDRERGAVERRRGGRDEPVVAFARAGQGQGAAPAREARGPEHQQASRRRRRRCGRSSIPTAPGALWAAVRGVREGQARRRRGGRAAGRLPGRRREDGRGVRGRPGRAGTAGTGRSSARRRPPPAAPSGSCRGRSRRPAAGSGR